MASFERWDDLIRQAVLWIAAQGIADLGDPTACIERAKDQEPERQKLAAFLEATAAVMEAKDWRVADLIRRVDQDWADGGPLQDALEEIASDRGKINPRILGRWIGRYANTRCAGYYLERRGNKAQGGGLVYPEIRRLNNGLTRARKSSLTFGIAPCATMPKASSWRRRCSAARLRFPPLA